MELKLDLDIDFHQDDETLQPVPAGDARELPKASDEYPEDYFGYAKV